MIDSTSTQDGKFTIHREIETGHIGFECNIPGSEFEIPIDEENIRELKNVLCFDLE